MITHIVHFGYKAHVDEAAKLEIAKRFLALAEDCKTKDTNQSYIQGPIQGGLNNSPEGMSHGLEHSFVVTFKNLEDRDYYLDHDPAHQAFKALLDGKLETATVMDFDQGVFQKEK